MTTPPDPLAINERPRRLPAQPAPPQHVVWQLLREMAAAEEDAAGDRIRSAARSDDLLGRFALDVADALHRLEHLPPQAAGESVPGIAERLHKALTSAGVRYLDPTGEFYEDVASWTDVEGSKVEAGITRAVVTETFRPGVLLDGVRLAQRARVYLAVPPVAPTAPAAEHPQRDGHMEEEPQ
jgi:hypothetical protein